MSVQSLMMFNKDNKPGRLFSIRGFNIVILVLFSFLLTGAKADNYFTPPDLTGLAVQEEGFGKRIVRYSAITAGGVLAFALDKDFRRVYQKPRLHGRSADSFFEQIENLGNQTPYYFIIPAFLGYGLIARSERSLRTGGELGGGLLGSLALTLGVKKAFGRLRPYESSSPYQFFDGGSSFYSGHTIVAFTAATIISTNYPKQNLGFMGIDRDFPVVPMLLYSAAGTVGVQRLYSDVHWSSDVYIGALAGYGMGKLAVYFGRKIDIGFLGVAPGETPMLVLRFAIN